MNLYDLETLEGLLDDIDRLKKRSALLEKILSFYDDNTMTFNVPEKWKGTRIPANLLPADTPRHLLRKEMQELLTGDELNSMGIWGIRD